MNGLGEIQSLKRKCDKLYREMLLAKARVYDVIFENMDEPTNAELKSRVIYLEDELKKVCQQRAQMRTMLDKYNPVKGVENVRSGNSQPR